MRHAFVECVGLHACTCCARRRADQSCAQVSILGIARHLWWCLLCLHVYFCGCVLDANPCGALRRATRSLSFCLVLRTIGTADGGSVGRRNWWHLLFEVLNTRVDADGGMTLLRHNKSYIFLNWCVSRDPKLSTPRV